MAVRRRLRPAHTNTKIPAELFRLARQIRCKPLKMIEATSTVFDVTGPTVDAGLLRKNTRHRSRDSPQEANFSFSRITQPLHPPPLPFEPATPRRSPAGAVAVARVSKVPSQADVPTAPRGFPAIAAPRKAPEHVYE